METALTEMFRASRDSPPGSALARLRDRLPLYCAFGSAVSIVLSIAASQILLGLGLVSLLVLRRPVRLPPIKLPLTLFLCATVLSDLLSPDPLAGLPQMKKLFVFAILPLTYSVFRNVWDVRLLTIAWTGCASISAARGFLQILHRRELAHQVNDDTYRYYLDSRITGFAGHWMTFGALEMITLLMLLAFLLFAKPTKLKTFGWVCLPVIWVGLVLGLTRSIFLLGVPLGVLFLVWQYKRWAVMLFPAVLLLLLAFPYPIRDRIESVMHPTGEMDSWSNAHRAITRRTGWEMIKAHPWFGLGPEQIKPQFDTYVSADIPRPLPRGWYGHLHNIYLQYAAERGLPALLLILWLIATPVVDFVRSLRVPDLDRDARYVLNGAIAVTIAILAEGFFEHNLGDSEVLTMFLIVIACGYVAIDSCAGQKPGVIGTEEGQCASL